jgi:hypothetical protein
MCLVVFPVPFFIGNNVVCPLEFIELVTQFTPINVTNVTIPNIRGKITRTRIVLAFQEKSSSEIFSAVGVAALSSVPSRTVELSEIFFLKVLVSVYCRICSYWQPSILSYTPPRQSI